MHDFQRGTTGGGRIYWPLVLWQDKKESGIMEKKGIAYGTWQFRNEHALLTLMGHDILLYNAVGWAVAAGRPPSPGSNTHPSRHEHTCHLRSVDTYESLLKTSLLSWSVVTELSLFWVADLAYFGSLPDIYLLLLGHKIHIRLDVERKRCFHCW